MEKTNAEIAGVDSVFAEEGATAVDQGAAVGNEEDDDLKYRFGCGPFKPKCLQKIFRNPIFFVLILSAYSILEGGVSSGIYTLHYAHTCANVFSMFLRVYTD